MILEEVFMQRCIDLALKGNGFVAPNPLVGAVLVYNDEIIGEGFHQKYGSPHAEPNCFDSVVQKNKHLISKSTLYVNLEPCAHWGKTPPCANRIIHEGVKNVIIGSKDPFSEVDGKGVRLLNEAGIACITGILEEKCQWLNRRFFTFHNKKRPYIILKWAETKDKYFAPNPPAKYQITENIAQQYAHLMRHNESAIMVGYTTASIDNPQLNDRFGIEKNPLRIVIDQNLQLPTTHNIYNNTAQTWIINSQRNNITSSTSFIQVDFQKPIIDQIINLLYEHQIQSIIIEGGAHLLNQFIDQNLWDEAVVFQGSRRLNTGIQAPSINHYKHTFNYRLGKDNLIIFENY
jgi:diaminohydroxyphosphoribosylaminopyrimidine deaminase/5-amino-6-(5-phosphoribosylamino)uracil reductase